MTTDFWIEKGWGDSVENATFEDIKIAIKETIQMNEEHGAFWIGNLENEYILEVHKDLELFFVFGQNQEDQLKSKFDNWKDVEHFFKLYLDLEFERLKNEIKSRPHSYKRLQNE